MGNRFASGKSSIAECDRCGQRYKLKQLKKEIIKLKTYNLLVCPECWDPDHPQLQLGMFPVDDPQAVRNPRHDQTYLVSGPNSAGNPSGGSRNIQWGWNPVGGASQFDAVLTPNYLVTAAELGTVLAGEAVLSPNQRYAYGALVGPGSTIVGSSEHLATSIYDPYYAYVTLLCHADQGYASSSFTDNSPIPTYIASAGAFGYTPAKFGPTSALFQYLNYAQADTSGGRYSFGSLPFTVEAWVTSASTTGGASYATLYGGTGGWELRLVYGASGLTPQLYVTDGVTSGYATATSTVNTGSFVHVAGVRDGNTLRIFVNGVQEDTDTFTGSVADNGSSTLGLGCYRSIVSGYADAGAFYGGLMDDMRITKGIARYTADFAPPIVAFPNTGPMPHPTTGALVGPGATVVGSANKVAIPVLHASSGSLIGTGAIVAGSSTLGEVDPYWADVSLLTNFGNNLSFRDGSTNNFAITRVGTVNPSLNTPFTGGVGGSQRFDGTASLTIPNSSQFQFGTGDYTIEFWLNTTSTYFNIASLNGAADGNWGFTLYSSQLIWWVWNNVSNLNSATASSILNGAWHHIAVTRSGTTNRIFMDGVLASATGIYNPDIYDYNGTGSFVMSTSAGRSGSISNLRILKGTALYTANFTPPTAPLTAITNTSLLITGTGQGMFDNSTFVDQGPNASTLTAVGAPVYSGSSPFGNTYPGSVLFNGTSQYLTSSYSTAAFDWWVTDFTIEAWVYPTTFAGWSTPANGVAGPTMIGNMDATTVYNYWSFGPTAAGFLGLAYYNGSSLVNQAVTSTTALSLNQWNHVAMTKTSSGITLFVNGIAQITTVIVGTPQSSAATPLTIGQFNSTAINGYVSNIRIVKGTALYPVSFPPITAAFPNNLSGDPFYNSVKCLYHFDADGADSGPLNVAATLSSPSAIDTATSKWGGGSLVGSQYAPYYAAPPASFPSTSDYDVGSQDFTLEMWLNPSTSTGGVVYNQGGLAGVYAIYSGMSISCTAPAIAFGARADISGGGTVVDLSAATGVAVGTWTHVAICRSGSNWTLFVNFTAVATAIYSGTIGYATGTANQIGRVYQYSPWGGYVDDFRLTIGVARYTTNFTPSTTPLTAVTGTSLLIRGDTGGFYDLSPVYSTVTPVNTAQIASSVVKYGTGSGQLIQASNGYLTIPYNAALNLASVPFTIELWANPSSAVNVAVVSKDGVSGVSYPQYLLGIQADGKVGLYLGDGSGTAGGYQYYLTSNTVALNQWAFIAVSVTSTTVYIFIDGVLGATGSRYAMIDGGKPLLIGYQASSPTSGNFDGYLDDIRITKGVARYTASFTPPAAPFPTS